MNKTKCAFTAVHALTGLKMTAYQMADVVCECQSSVLPPHTYGWQVKYSLLTDSGRKFLKHWSRTSSRTIEFNSLTMDMGTIAEVKRSMVLCSAGDGVEMVFFAAVNREYAIRQAL